MNKALVIGLFPSVEALRSLLATMVCFNRASNWLLDTIGEGKPARRLALQKHYRKNAVKPCTLGQGYKRAGI